MIKYTTYLRKISKWARIFGPIAAFGWTLHFYAEAAWTLLQRLL